MTITPGAGPTFVAELLFTFALAHVILNVATSRVDGMKVLKRMKDMKKTRGRPLT